MWAMLNYTCGLHGITCGKPVWLPVFTDVIWLGLGDIENSVLGLLQQWYHNIALL